MLMKFLIRVAWVRYDGSVEVIQKVLITSGGVTNTFSLVNILFTPNSDLKAVMIR